MKKITLLIFVLLIQWHCGKDAQTSPGTGVGGSLAMTLPPRVAELVRGGMELGHAMDAVTGTHNVKQGLGAVGILTHGLVTRQQAYETLVAYAFVPLLEGR